MADNVKQYDIRFTKRDRQLIVLLFAAILIVIAALLLLSNSSRIGGNNNNNQYNSECNGYIYPQQKINCTMQLATSTSNSTLCYNLPEYEMAQCIYNIAIAQKNLSMCNAISVMTPFHDQCILMLVGTSKNYSACGGLGSALAPECIYNLSLASNFSNQTVCNSIKNQTYNAQCNSIYSYNKAILTKNAAYCKSLQSTQNATALYTIINNYTNKNNITSSSIFTAFAYSELNISPRDWCYYKLAKQENNQSLCAFTTTAMGNTLCKALFETVNQTVVTPPKNATNVTAACGIKTAKSYNYCSFIFYSNNAIQINNGSVCGNVAIPQERDACFLLYSANTLTTKYCGSISNVSERSVCYNQSQGK